jgi:hypothetical protein
MVYKAFGDQEISKSNETPGKTFFTVLNKHKHTHTHTHTHMHEKCPGTDTAYLKGHFYNDKAKMFSNEIASSAYFLSKTPVKSEMWQCHV